jgi:hypothetical protein
MKMETIYSSERTSRNVALNYRARILQNSVSILELTFRLYEYLMMLDQTLTVTSS